MRLFVDICTFGIVVLPAKESESIPESDLVLYVNGRVLQSNCPLYPNCTVEACVRLCGGKGGYS